MSKLTGKVAQIIGPVIDVAFATEGTLPRIYDYLHNVWPYFSFPTS